MEVGSTLLSITFVRLAPIFRRIQEKWMLKCIRNRFTMKSQHWIRTRYREMRRIQLLTFCCGMNSKWRGCQKFIHCCSRDAEVVRFGNHSFLPNEKVQPHTQHVSAAFIDFSTVIKSWKLIITDVEHCNLYFNNLEINGNDIFHKICQ